MSIFYKVTTPDVDGAPVTVDDGAVRHRNFEFQPGDFTPPAWVRGDGDNTKLVRVAALPWRVPFAFGQIEVLSSDPRSGGSGSGTPDPTLLSIASGQVNPSPGFLDGMSFGQTTTDPTTGVTIIAASDSENPLAANVRVVPDYGDGGPFISLPWTNGQGETMYTLHFQARDAGGTRHMLMDFNYDTETFSNARTSPVGIGSNEIIACFSYNPATPQILYYLAGASALHRHDTSTDTDDDTGNFPKDLSAEVGGGELDWLTVDINDQWFVCQQEFDGGTIVAWNSSTDGVITQANIEPHIIRSGWGAMGAPGQASNHGDLTGQSVTNTKLLRFSDGATIDPDQPARHPSGTTLELNGKHYFRSDDPHQGGGAQAYRFDVTETETGGGHVDGETHFGAPGALIPAPAHSACQWNTDNGSTLATHWTLVSTYGTGGDLPHAIGFVPMDSDGTDARLLCHTDTDGNTYYEQPHATISPDGKLVMWGSNHNNTGGRPDMFLAKVPLAA